MKMWLKRASITLFAIIAILSIWGVVAPPDPENCSICGHIKCHAPCLLNLSTGEIGELELYQPHELKVGEIAENQTGGTFSFIYSAGLQAIRLTEPWYIEITVPVKGERKDETHFCTQCRILLDSYTNGYVVLDIYESGSPQVYGIYENSNYDIRCYEVRVFNEGEDKAVVLRIDGKLNLD